MRFAQPWAFLALLLVPVFALAYWGVARRRARRLAMAADPNLLSQMALVSSSASSIRTAQVALTATALALVAVALARPQFGLRTEVRRARGMDVVIALDLSRSMLAQDVVPSRLARARIELADLIDQLGGDRIGLLGFTSLPLPLCPLTVDRAALKLQLNAASPDDLPRGGTAIGLAIEEGLKMLENARATGASQAIVVVTDGEEHEGDPEAAAKKAAEAGVQVHVVGVGSRTGEPIPLVDEKGRSQGYLKDRSGRTVVSRLNEAMLRKIADAGSGLVALPGAQGGIDLNPVRRQLSTLRRAELEDRVVRVYEERYQWFLVPAFVLLVLASVLRPSKPRRRLVVSGLSALLLWATAGSARAAGPLESEDPDVAAGNAALADGKAVEAQQAYQRARNRLGARADLLFNEALADVGRGELDQAISGFKAAANQAVDPTMQGKASYALGNTLRQLKRYDEALEAYKAALLADPSLSGARRNYEITQRIKAIQEAQPKDEDPEGDQNDEESPPDGGTGDAGPQDGGGGEGGGSDGGAPDAGTPGDGGRDPSDGGGEGSEDASAPSTPDAGATTDAGSASPPPSPAEEEEPEEVDRQQAEAILDALQDQEEALKRERLLRQYKGRAVTKDW